MSARWSLTCGRRAPRRIRAFIEARQGSAAVEFALVATAFFGLLAAIFEVALIALGNQYLISAAQTVARQAQIGAISNDSVGRDEVRTAICDAAHGLFDCDLLRLRVTTYDDFATAAVELSGELPEDLADYEAFDTGGPDEIVVFRVLYEWPVLMFKPMADRGDGSFLMIATTVVRNEVAASE